MSVKTKIFIAIALISLVAIIVIVIQYNKRKGPTTESTTYTKQTTGLSAVGGIGELTGLITSLSDERYKTNISLTGYGEAYNQIKTVKPIEYMYTRADGTRPCEICEKPRIGFSAQQLEKVNPNLVITDENGIKYIDNAQLVAMNTAAIKDLIQKFESGEYLKGLVASQAIQGAGPTDTTTPRVL